MPVSSLFSLNNKFEDLFLLQEQVCYVFYPLKFWIHHYSDHLSLRNTYSLLGKQIHKQAVSLLSICEHRMYTYQHALPGGHILLRKDKTLYRRHNLYIRPLP